MLESLTCLGRFARLLRAGLAAWINRSCPSLWAGYSDLKTIGSELLVWDGKLFKPDPCWMLRVKMTGARDYHQDSFQPCHRLALLLYVLRHCVIPYGITFIVVSTKARFNLGESDVTERRTVTLQQPACHVY